MHIFPSAAGIEAARGSIDPVFLDTPLRRDATLDRLLGATLVFKDETANPIRSFKGRGACRHVALLPAAATLVCASAGNFGQGLAWAARRHGCNVVVFASRHAVRRKIDAMRALGADVRIAGEDFDAAKTHARAFAAQSAHCFVEDGAHADIAEGAGTLALELVRDSGRFDAALVPLGNGALVAGIGTWFRHAAPSTRVVAVSARGAPAMAAAMRSGIAAAAAHADTIADGIAVRVPIDYAVAAARRVVDESAVVDDAAIRTAMALLREHLGLVVEPAGAVGLAAVIAERERWRGARIAIPLCGGNVDAAGPSPPFDPARSLT
jgi:threonine dehydratase